MKLNETYRPEFDQIAYDVLSSKGLQGKIHVCSALRCTSETLEKWLKEHESFRNAIDLGLIDGEIKFREKLKELSLRPSKKINQNLILLLANNVYNLQHEFVTEVKETRNAQNDTEKILRQKGIPIPNLSVSDI